MASPARNPDPPAARDSLRVTVAVVALEALLLTSGFLLGRPLLGAGLAAAVAYAVLAYLRPNVAWILVWLAFPFSIEILMAGGHALHVPTEPMIAIALVAWALQIRVDRPIRLPRSRLHLPLATLGTAVLVSLAQGPYPLLGLKAWLIAGAYVVFGYVFCVATWDGIPRVRRMFPWMVGAAAIWGIFGAVQVAAKGISLTHAYGAVRPFFTEHGSYAAYLAFALPAAILLAAERDGRHRVLYAAAAVAITLGVVLSFTRAVWLALAVVVPTTVLLWSWRRRTLMPIVLMALLGIVVLVSVSAIGGQEGVSRHAGTIAERTDPSNLERLNRWTAALEMTRARPWLGFGLGSYPLVYPEYRRKTMVTGLAYQRMGPHSEVFRLLSESGIVGFLAACWFLGAVSTLGLRIVRRVPDRWSSLLALAALAGIGTYCIHGFFRTYIDLEKVSVPFWAAVGLLAGLERELEPPRS